MTDKQTKNISQGINLLLCYYPETKLLVDYDKEIVMILPKDIRLEDHLGITLKRLGWENLEYYPYMWQYKVEGDVAEYYV
jgi:hypothetical protein